MQFHHEIWLINTLRRGKVALPHLTTRRGMERQGHYHIFTWVTRRASCPSVRGETSESEMEITRLVPHLPYLTSSGRLCLDYMMHKPFNPNKVLGHIRSVVENTTVIHSSTPIEWTVLYRDMVLTSSSLQNDEVHMAYAALLAELISGGPFSTPAWPCVPSPK